MRGSRLMSVTFVTLSLVLAACGHSVRGNGDDDDTGVDAAPGRDGPPGVNEFVDAAPPQACTKMDIVFVIDDSGSMAEEQENLATNFPNFIQVINDFVTTDGAALDYRVAITTTGRDVDYSVVLPGFGALPFSEQGDDGAFRQSCGMPRRWLERADGNVAQTFSCAAQVGTSGPSIEMPLYAAELALRDRVTDGTNAGFLREDALLALVFLTDENDCSRTDNGFQLSMSDVCDASQPLIPVADSLAFLDGLKMERGRWAAAVIAGPGPGDCTSAFGQAAEATRLLQFVGDAGQNAIFSSICDGDLTGALHDALSTFQAACEAFPPIP